MIPAFRWVLRPATSVTALVRTINPHTITFPLVILPNHPESPSSIQPPVCGYATHTMTIPTTIHLTMRTPVNDNGHRCLHVCAAGTRAHMRTCCLHVCTVRSVYDVDSVLSVYGVHSVYDVCTVRSVYGVDSAGNAYTCVQRVHVWALLAYCWVSPSCQCLSKKSMICCFMGSNGW